VLFVGSVLIALALPAFAQLDQPASKARNVNVVNEPFVKVRGPVEVDAYQAGEWYLEIGEVAKELKHLTGHFTVDDGWMEVYEVLTGKRLVLTDIYFLQRTYGDWHNTISLFTNSTNECGIGGSSLMYVKVRGAETTEQDFVHFPLSTGYEINEGTKICVAQSGGGLIFYNLSGYETDM
jgi:hypothetical protein